MAAGPILEIGKDAWPFLQQIEHHQRHQEQVRHHPHQCQSAGACPGTQQCEHVLGGVPVAGQPFADRTCVEFELDAELRLDPWQYLCC